MTAEQELAKRVNELTKRVAALEVGLAALTTKFNLITGDEGRVLRASKDTGPQARNQPTATKKL
jgi:hypothetical protein